MPTNQLYHSGRGLQDSLCMYVCVLSLLAGTLTLLKLLFYGHCESFQFSELLLLFSSPHSFSRCLHFVSQKILWRAVLWVRSLETDLAFWSSGKSLWALSKKKGKENEKMKKDILMNVRKTDLTSIASLGMLLEKGISGVMSGRGNMKRSFTSKPNTDFLREWEWG